MALPINLHRAAFPVAFIEKHKIKALLTATFYLIVQF